MSKPAVRPVVWAVAAVAVIATATAFITASLVADDSVLSPQDVDRALAGATGTPSANPPSAHAPSGSAPETAATATAGERGPDIDTSQLVVLEPATVTVACRGALAELVSWSPNPGWRADDPERGPAVQVSVRFESDTDADYKVTATCVDGAPVVNLGPDDDHGGGDRRGRGRGRDD